MTLAELLALRRPADPEVNMDQDAVTGEELAGFGDFVVNDQRCHNWHVCERHVDNTVEMVLAEYYFGCGCAALTWYRITAWTTVTVGFEWRHLYFDNSGYLYYPSGKALIAFIERAMSHIPEDER